MGIEDVKFKLGDKVWYMMYDIEREAEMFYCPECGGTGHKEVFHEKYNMKTSTLCPLCFNRRTVAPNEHDKALGNTYRTTYHISHYVPAAGRIGRIYYEESPKQSEIKYYIENLTRKVDSLTLHQEGIYASEEECINAIKEIEEKQREEVDKYIGKKAN